MYESYICILSWSESYACISVCYESYVFISICYEMLVSYEMLEVHGNGGRMHVILNGEPLEEMDCFKYLGRKWQLMEDVNWMWYPE